MMFRRGIRGLGDEAVNTTVIPGTSTTVTAAPLPEPSLTNGLRMWWPNPMNGFTAVQAVFSNASAAFSSQSLPFTIGVLLPPLALLVLLTSGGGGRRR